MYVLYYIYRPYQIVLLDEIEKAHIEVTNVLLQVFDEGHLTDSHGRKVDFRNTIIIMTSNLGTRGEGGINFAEVESAGAQNELILQGVRNHFAPEFINRIDEVVCFRPLGWDDMKPIMTLQLNGIQDLLTDRQVHVTYSEDLVEWLCKKGYDPTYGARPLKRAVQNYVLNPLSQAILKGDVLDGSTVSLSVTEDQEAVEISVVAQHSEEKNVLEQ